MNRVGRLPSAPRSRPSGRAGCAVSPAAPLRSTGARGSQPIVPDSPRLLAPAPRAIDLNAVAHQESRLQTAPLSELVLEHGELSRWLDLPYAEMWADQHAEKTERIKAVWQTIRRRFPEYAKRWMESGR